jgi:hypothetical protein
LIAAGKTILKVVGFVKTLNLGKFENLMSANTLALLLENALRKANK